MTGEDTKGLWKAKRGQYMSSIEGPMVDNKKPLSGLIAFTYHSKHYANARLMAAAPELLEVCERLVNAAKYPALWEVWTTFIKNEIVPGAKAAIIKAKGEACLAGENTTSKPK